MRIVLMALSVLASSIPTFAKSPDVYPASCDVLWDAIKDSLSNASDYSIVAINDTAHRAAFLVVGELTPHTDRVVALTSKEGGCAMKLAFVEIGFNDNERVFRKRVKKSMAKIEAAQPTATTRAATSPD